MSSTDKRPLTTRATSDQEHENGPPGGTASGGTEKRAGTHPASVSGTESTARTGQMHQRQGGTLVAENQQQGTPATTLEKGLAHKDAPLKGDVGEGSPD